MQKTLRGGLALALIMAMTLSTASCANIANDRTRTQTEGTLAGAGVGAAIGGLIGALTGNRNTALAGAAIGAGVGALGGLAYGTHVANKKAEYATEEEWLNACIQEAQSANQAAAAYRDRLKATLAKSGTGGSGYAFSDSGSSKGSNPKQEANKQLAAIDNDLANRKKVLAETGANAQTKKLQQETNNLEKIRSEIAGMSSRISG
ncbi:MAG: hypothetical protein LBP55_09360 [Candidatus Adiutrix sp.]|jgi:hypothetical protein|nr:hypothetical protein [Candidatus Adiutrix sp.]